MSHVVTQDSAGLGALVQRYRLPAGITQEELAERTELSVRSVRNLERGRVRRPRSETVQRIVRALRITEYEAERLWLDDELAAGAVQGLLDDLIAAADGKSVVVMPVVVCCAHAALPAVPRRLFIR